eukprot:3518955-Rhodomonas_salina.1
MQRAKSTSSSGGGSSRGSRASGANSGSGGGSKGSRAASSKSRSGREAPEDLAAKTSTQGKNASRGGNTLPVPSTRSPKSKKRAPLLNVDHPKDEFARTSSMEWRPPGSRGRLDADQFGRAPSSAGSSGSRGSSGRGSRDPS